MAFGWAGVSMGTILSACPRARPTAPQVIANAASAVARPSGARDADGCPPGLRGEASVVG